MIYMDDAATTKMTPAAAQAMLSCCEESWYNPSGIYGPGQRSFEALSSAGERIAACLNALPEEIIFTLGGKRGGQPGHHFRSSGGGQSRKEAYPLHRV